MSDRCRAPCLMFPPLYLVAPFGAGSWMAWLWNWSLHMSKMVTEIITLSMKSRGFRLVVSIRWNTVKDEKYKWSPNPTWSQAFLIFEQCGWPTLVLFLSFFFFFPLRLKSLQARVGQGSSDAKSRFINQVHDALKKQSGSYSKAVLCWEKLWHSSFAAFFESFKITQGYECFWSESFWRFSLDRDAW